MRTWPRDRSLTTRLLPDVATNDQLLKAEQYRPLIVGYSNGAAIKLSDIANVQDSGREHKISRGRKWKALRAGNSLSPARSQYHRHGRQRPCRTAAIEGIDPSAIDLTVVMDQNDHDPVLP